MKISRTWSMPNSKTFFIPPISEFLDKWLEGTICVIDPFSGESKRGSIRNDLGFGGEDAIRWLDDLIEEDLAADAVLLDPPYSPRQMAEVYRSVGRSGMEISQNARLYKEAKERLTLLLKPGGVALSFGWNSAGFGPKFKMEEILLVAHGGAHNDTICVAEIKL